MPLERSRAAWPGRRARRTAVAALLAVGLGLVAAGCLGSSGTKTAATTPGSTPPATTASAPATTPAATTAAAPATRTVRVYVVKDGKLSAEPRAVPSTEGVGTAALRALLDDSSVALTITNGVAAVTGVAAVSHEKAAEIVATLTQFPTVTSVSIDGAAPLTRADIEDVTPQILLESPLPGDRVASPITLRGTANTFEASFIVEVLDKDGKALSQKTVTATSGSGERGTFATQIGFDTADEQAGTLYLYEPSAEDGHPIHEVRVPLTLLP